MSKPGAHLTKTRPFLNDSNFKIESRKDLNTGHLIAFVVVVKRTGVTHVIEIIGDEILIAWQKVERLVDPEALRILKPHL